MTASFLTTLAVVLLGIALFASLRSVRTVPAHAKGLVTRLGRYTRTVEPGTHWVMPVLDDVIVVDLREHLVEVPVAIATADDQRLDLLARVYYHVVDPVKATYEVNDRAGAMRSLTETHLHEGFGGRTRADALADRDHWTSHLRASLGRASDWGLELGAIELRLSPRAGATEAGSPDHPAVAEGIR